MASLRVDATVNGARIMRRADYGLEVGAAREEPQRAERESDDAFVLQCSGGPVLRLVVHW